MKIVLRVATELNCSYIPGPAEAMCSVASNSRVTGFPGSTELTADTVEKTVDDTEDCRDDAKRVRCSMLIFGRSCQDPVAA